jgi:hypothetical protein
MRQHRLSCLWMIPESTLVINICLIQISRSHVINSRYRLSQKHCGCKHSPRATGGSVQSRIPCTYAIRIKRDAHFSQTLHGSMQETLELVKSALLVHTSLTTSVHPIPLEFAHTYLQGTLLCSYSSIRGSRGETHDLATHS